MLASFLLYCVYFWESERSAHWAAVLSGRSQKHVLKVHDMSTLKVVTRDDDDDDDSNTD